MLILGTACAVLLACWYMLKTTSAKLRIELQQEIERLWLTVRKLERDIEISPKAEQPEVQSTSSEQEVDGSSPIPAVLFASPSCPEILPETKAAIEATLFAAIGHKVRVHSIKAVENVGILTPWATQGRVAVQTSHNRRPGGD